MSEQEAPECSQPSEIEDFEDETSLLNVPKGEVVDHKGMAWIYY